MPAGGTWQIQNKRRPGAYINFNAVPAPSSSVGSTGVMLTVLPMDWGETDTLIELTGEELLSGKSMEKIGFYWSDEQSLPYRLGLMNCYKMLIYRANSNGTKASVTQGGVTMTARYEGIAGNNLQVVIVANRPTTGKFEVSVLYNGARKEVFSVETEDDFRNIDSAWIDFTVEQDTEGTEETAQVGLAGLGILEIGVVSDNADAPVEPSAGLSLVGGTNGTIDYSQILPELFDKARLRSWSTFALPTTDIAAIEATINAIEEMRNVDGKMVQAALAYSTTNTQPTVDDEAFIASFQGFTFANGEICSPSYFPLYVAGLNSGTQLGESNTCNEVVPTGGEIINAIPDGVVEDYLDRGWFLLTYRTDGAIVIEQDINTLRTYTSNRPADYQKNLVIRLLNYIAAESQLIFVRDFAGKVRANKQGRDLYRARMLSFFLGLQDADAIINFTADDLVVYAGEQPEGVVLEVAVQYVDAMEKLYMTVNIVA